MRPNLSAIRYRQSSYLSSQVGYQHTLRGNVNRQFLQRKESEHPLAFNSSTDSRKFLLELLCQRFLAP